MKKILLILLSLSVLCSCSKFLTEKPITSIYDETAYDTERNLEANVTAIYSSLSSYLASQSFCWYMNLGSRYISFTGNRKTEAFTQWQYFTAFSNNSQTATFYRSGYETVGLCNSLLDVLEKSPVAEEYKVEIAAEARFLRAYTYFTLARMFGGLVIVEHAPSKLEDSFKPRSTFSEVYSFIFKDLDYAEEHMRSKDRQETVNPNAGRSYRNAATALKAKIYAQIACYLQYSEDNFYDITKPGHAPDFTDLGITDYRSAWEKCIAAVDEVEASGVYALESDYRHLFRWDPINHPEDYKSKERILVLNHTTNGQSFYYPQVTLWENPVGTNAKTVQMSVAGRIRCSVWVWEKWCKKYGGSQVLIGGYNTWTNCQDPRLDATYAHTSVSSYDRETGIIKDVEVFPAESKIATTTSGHPFIKKYFSKSFNLDAGDADLYLLRYADILLIGAEAHAELSTGQGDTHWMAALEKVNKVLERARNSVDDSAASEYPKDWEVSDYTTREQLVSEIMWERVFEMNCECHEWFDSHKRGAKWLVDNVSIPINTFLENPQWQEYKEQAFWDKDVIIDIAKVRKGLLLAFPEYEIRYNTALTDADQNDFYVL